jgi:tetratricopeptide (TPR) repeat protein
MNNARRGADDLRKSLAELAGQGIRAFTPAFRGFLAELETAAGETERALAAIDEGFVTARDGGQHFADAFLHRLRGDILLKRSPADPAPAEEAYRTAIAIAREQGALSYELLASLALAKLYQSTSRLAEAHAVLAPALEGFSPTPEMPEIAAAQALLAALAETKEVKAAIAQQQRRGQLQVAYGNALIAARGFTAPETTEAFARARMLSTSEKDGLDRLAADFGLWLSSYPRADLPSMRKHAADCLADVATRPDSPEAGAAHRALGITHYFAGEYAEARSHLERALSLFEPGRDDDVAFRFGTDPGVAAMVYLAFVLWSVGEIERALPLVERMRERISGLTHANTLALGAMHATMFELMRGERSRVPTNALELALLWHFQANGLRTCRRQCGHR